MMLRDIGGVVISFALGMREPDGNPKLEYLGAGREAPSESDFIGLLSRGQPPDIPAESQVTAWEEQDLPGLEVEMIPPRVVPPRLVFDAGHPPLRRGTQ